jgi:hypothetical protein
MLDPEKITFAEIFATDYDEANPTRKTQRQGRPVVPARQSQQAILTAIP